MFEIRCVKIYRSILSSAFLLTLAFAFSAQADQSWQTDYKKAQDDMKAKWDLAVMPSYKGQVYAPTDADTFRIHKDTKNPDAAFTVLSYLLASPSARDAQ